MFINAFILVLLGSSLVMAAPSADPNWVDTVSGWYNSARDSAQNLYGSAVDSVNKFYESAKANAAYAAELTEDGLAYLREKGNALKDSTLAQIKAANDAAQAKINELNESVDKTSKVLADESEQILAEMQKKIAQVKEAGLKKWEEEVKKAQEYYGKKA